MGGKVSALSQLEESYFCQLKAHPYLTEVLQEIDRILYKST
jgi:hypothetical protein